MRTITRAVTTVLAGLMALALTAAASQAASPFEGVWKVTDTGGKAFEITLAADGTAKGTQEEGMTGSWSEEGDSAVISWDSGWTTVIAKDGDKYTKSAYKDGSDLEGDPTNSGPAEKVK